MLDGSFLQLNAEYGFAFSLQSHPELERFGRELDLIDHGLEEMGEAENDKGETELVIRCAFNDFGRLQRAIEEKGLTVISAEAEYIPTAPTELPEDAATEVLKMIDRLEQDDDVQKVFHNLA